MCVWRQNTFAMRSIQYKHKHQFSTNINTGGTVTTKSNWTMSSVKSCLLQRHGDRKYKNSLISVCLTSNDIRMRSILYKHKHGRNGDIQKYLNNELVKPMSCFDALRKKITSYLISVTFAWDQFCTNINTGGTLRVKSNWTMSSWKSCLFLMHGERK